MPWINSKSVRIIPETLNMNLVTRMFHQQEKGGYFLETSALPCIQLVLRFV